MCVGPHWNASVAVSAPQLRREPTALFGDVETSHAYRMFAVWEAAEAGLSLNCFADNHGNLLRAVTVPIVLYVTAQPIIRRCP